MENYSGEDKRRMAGQCTFLSLCLFSTSAFFCGLYASVACNFVARDITFKDGLDATSACALLNLTSVESETCGAFLENHAVGFYSWYGVVPVDEEVCLSYTMYVPNVGYVTPEFDTKFNSARALAVSANVFGAIGTFTLLIASCCVLTQQRLKRLSFFFFLATLFQGLSLLIFKSDICKAGFLEQYYGSGGFISSSIESVSCSLDTGSKLALSATVLYFMCMNLMPAAVAPPPIGWQPGADRDAEVGASSDTGNADE